VAAEPLLHVLMGTIIAGVRSHNASLTARQLSVFLKIYLEPGVQHTVRGLATELNVLEPAITRALNRLEGLNFARRQTHPEDRRSVIIKKTKSGSAYLRTLHGYVITASKQATK
jgi:DNA-binding MarR family transcriptional regulator